MPINVNELARMFAETVTDQSDEQDISFLLVGAKGTGKSRASLSIAYHTAMELAEILDGDRANWPRYFNIDNLAVIDATRATWVLTHTRDYDVIDLDDIGVGYNSRKFATNENQDKNDVMMTNRVERTVKIMSIPLRGQLDKVPRDMLTHYGVMVGKHKKEKVSELKLFKPIQNHRNGKQYEPYILNGNDRMVRYFIDLPPKEIDDAYAKLRKAATQKLKEEKWTKFEEAHGCGGDPGRKSLKERQMYERASEFIEVYESFLLNGCSEKEARKEALRETKTPRSTMQSWKERGVFKDLGVKA